MGRKSKTTVVHQIMRVEDGFSTIFTDEFIYSSFLCGAIDGFLLFDVKYICLSENDLLCFVLLALKARLLNFVFQLKNRTTQSYIVLALRFLGRSSNKFTYNAIFLVDT